MKVDQAVAQTGTRESILKNAEVLVSDNGIQNVTISEIAKRTGVADSVIYHYFKNKEDLVFSIAKSHFRNAYNELHDQLEGILEPVSKLSKMIWYHLRYGQTHYNYPRIWLFECRANRSFYKHSAYQAVRKYAEVLLSILQEGVKQGSFRNDVTMRLVRELIFGAMDWEILQGLATPSEPYQLSHIQEIMALILPMIETPPRKLAENNDKASRIVEAAEQMFSQCGYKNSGIKKIARLANVAEGTVYEHFKNKEELLFYIPKLRWTEHFNSITEVFEVKTPIKKLARFIQHHFMLILTQPMFIKTFLLDLQLNPRFYETEAFAIFQDYCCIVDQILEAGKIDGSVRESVDTDKFKNLLFGGFNHLALRWLILKPGQKTDRLAEMDETIKLLTRAVIYNP
ncbi:MAG: TetR/AcrR family transcriptional regulator [Desulfarculus sp.]|nr:MAG: TetR/AcrR family transcriptional regulator [Desulfarculus sp.]